MREIKDQYQDIQIKNEIQSFIWKEILNKKKSDVLNGYY